MAAMFVNGLGRNEQWGPSIDASYQGSVHLAEGFLEAYLSVIQFIANCILLISIFKLVISLSTEKHFFSFRKHTIINMNCLWWPCLLMDRDEMSNLYRGPSIDASYQVSVHLAEGFQRRRLKCEKLTDDRQRTTSDGKSSHCLWQGELKMWNNF
jgi:hypothetical protein